MGKSQRPKPPKSQQRKEETRLCPNCHGPLPAEDVGHWCPKCRSKKGMLIELWQDVQLGAALDQDECPQICQLSCGRFGHQAFTQETMKRLLAWLQARVGKTEGEILAMQRREVVELLQDVPLTTEDVAILEVLRENHSRLLTQEDIEGAVPKNAVALRTIQKRLPRLVRRGLVERPEGKRSGYWITNAGRAAIDRKK